jgi:hypothetical protein
MGSGSTRVEGNKTVAPLFAVVESSRAAKGMKVQSFAIPRSAIRNLQYRTNKRGPICPGINTVIECSVVKYSVVPPIVKLHGRSPSHSLDEFVVIESGRHMYSGTLLLDAIGSVTHGDIAIPDSNVTASCNLDFPDSFTPA